MEELNKLEEELRLDMTSNEGPNPQMQTKISKEIQRPRSSQHEQAIHRPAISHLQNLEAE